MFERIFGILMEYVFLANILVLVILSLHLRSDFKTRWAVIDLSRSNKNQIYHSQSCRWKRLFKEEASSWRREMLSLRREGIAVFFRILNDLDTGSGPV